jgi:hypothetical protein
MKAMRVVMVMAIIVAVTIGMAVPRRRQLVRAAVNVVPERARQVAHQGGAPGGARRSAGRRQARRARRAWCTRSRAQRDQLGLAGRWRSSSEVRLQRWRAGHERVAIIRVQMVPGYQRR